MKKKTDAKHLLSIDQLLSYVDKGFEHLQKNSSLFREYVKQMHKVEAKTSEKLFRDLTDHVTSQTDRKSDSEIQKMLLYCILMAMLDENLNLKQQVKQISDTYDDVVGLITHEFKNILTSVHGYNMLIESELKEAELEHIRNNLSASDRLTKQLFDMSDSLLKMSLGEKGLLDPEYKLINLIEDVIKPVMNDLQPELQRRGMSIQLNKTSSDPLLEADDGLMDIVIRNLLINATRYGKENSTIFIKVGSNVEQVNVSLKNQCLKVPADFCRGIFNKFQKKNIGSTKGGSGLGLYNVQNIISMHKGKITCSTSEGKWIEFRFNIPKKISV